MTTRSRAGGRAARRRRRPIRVIFVCTGNSARSQMAEALLRHDGGDRFEVVSAGVDPRGVHPMTIRALAKVGIDITRRASKSVGEFLGQRFDYVITVCDRARATCPVFPGGAETLHWGIDDPGEARTEERQVAFDRHWELAVRSTRSCRSRWPAHDGATPRSAEVATVRHGHPPGSQSKPTRSESEPSQPIAARAVPSSTAVAPRRLRPLQLYLLRHADAGDPTGVGRRRRRSAAVGEGPRAGDAARRLPDGPEAPTRTSS